MAMEMHVGTDHAQATMSGKGFSRLVTGLRSTKTFPDVISETALVRMSGGQLSLETTDLTTTVRSSVVTGYGDWRGVVSLRDLRTIAKAAKSARDVTLETSDATSLRITVRTMTGDETTSTLARFRPAEDWPETSVVDATGRPLVSCGSEVFRSELAAAVYAMSTDETRPHLSAVSIETSPDDLRMIATDGHRMAIRTYRGAFNGCWDASRKRDMLVSAACVDAFARASKGMDGPVHVFATLELVSFRTTCSEYVTDVTSKLVQASFPLWRQCLYQVPSKGIDAFHVVTIERAALLRAVQSVTHKGRDAVLALTFDVSGGCEIRCDDPDTGYSASVRAPVTTLEWPTESHRLRIGFNARYLTEMLQATTDVFLTWRMEGHQAPLEVHAGEKLGDVVALVMPRDL